MALEEVFGWLAAVFTTLILAPQLFKAIYTRMTRDISMLMLILSVLGNASWLAHASLTSNAPLIACASIIIIMSATLIIFKYMNEKSQS